MAEQELEKEIVCPIEKWDSLNPAVVELLETLKLARAVMQMAGCYDFDSGIVGPSVALIEETIKKMESKS